MTIGVILISTIIVLTIRYRNSKEKERLKLQFKETQLKELPFAQEEKERKRLARELHDGIGQSLAALKIQLEMDKKNKTSEKNQSRLELLCKEVRNLSHQMMPLILQENGPDEATAKLVQSSLRGNGIATDLVIHGLDERLESNTEIHLYRILQELISNVIRHAEANKVGIQLLKRKDKLLLMVEDNGKGFSKEVGQ